MLGLYRTILALLVLYSHVYIPKTNNIGLCAVVEFFMISGFVMTQLIHRCYGRLGRPTLYFYLDRFLRIYPQYFLFLCMMQISILVFRFQFGPFTGTPSFLGFGLNALIIPLNYTSYFQILQNYFLIPAAWSLALEEQYYLVFPFIVLNKRLGHLVAILSFALFCFNIFSYGDPDLLYRRVPSILFVFMLGKYLAEYRTTQSKEPLWMMCILYGACLVLFNILTIFDQYAFTTPSTDDVLNGILVGFPILVGLSYLPRKKWDEIVGRASYGIFLSHTFCLSLFLQFHLFTDSRPKLLLGVALSSIALSALGYTLAEKTIQPLRYRLRRTST